MTTDTKAPLPDMQTLQLIGEINRLRDLIDKDRAHIAALEADNKRLREALKPFADSYIKNNVLSGCSGFVKLCADSTSPANWFDAADALAGGKVGA